MRLLHHYHDISLSSTAPFQSSPLLSFYHLPSVLLSFAYCPLHSFNHPHAYSIQLSPLSPYFLITLSPYPTLQNYELLLQGKNDEVAFAEASLVEIQTLFEEARRGLPHSAKSSAAATYVPLQHYSYFMILWPHRMERGE